jgi:hypothetical protein
VPENLSNTVPTFPVARPRPALDRWCRDHDLDDAAAARLFGCTKQMVNAMRRPFDDETRKRPGRDLLTRIVRVTKGVVRPEDFSPPVAAILGGMAA